jgi:hypothetical protein
MVAKKKGRQPRALLAQLQGRFGCSVRRTPLIRDGERVGWGGGEQREERIQRRAGSWFSLLPPKAGESRTAESESVGTLRTAKKLARIRL